MSNASTERLGEDTKKKIEAHLSEIDKARRPVVIILKQPRYDGEPWDIDVKVTF